MNAMLEVIGRERPYTEGVMDLESLLLHVMEEEKSDRKIIVEVKVDGEVYSEKYSHHARDIDLDKIKMVQITTQKGETFARDFLEQVDSYMQSLQEGFRAAANLLRDPEREKSGYDILAKSLEALSALKSLFENVWDVLGEGEGLDVRNALWKGFEVSADKIMEVLTENDPRAMADLIEEDILPFLEKWKSSMA